MDAVGNGFDMRIGIAFTNDKKVCWRVAKFPKIKLNDLFAFFVTDTLNDEVVELFELRLLRALFGNADQIVERI